MNLEHSKGKGASLEENENTSTVSSPFNEKAKGQIGIFKSRSKSKIGLGSKSSYGECFANNNFASQYEDECPVNYSLKYSETESCKSSISKREITNKKFKDYSDYAETDLDQPMDFSLKYAEKTCDEDNKSTTFNYFNNCKVKFKEYTDYVEIDLDQPTDFTLKYRESTEEDVKNLDFNYYESEEGKTSNAFGLQTGSEGASERYTSQNETPMMFSRSSSMNSLSSFVHITQSIPDDRSSIMSDFSRMTSGIISPSELPDSPTQTAPSSPKRQKPSSVFSAKTDFLTKQSVFEDDLASYKQEGTPIEFSGATSLSSLNIENSIKSEFGIKHNSSSVIMMKEENRTSVDQIQVHTEHLKQQNDSEKLEQEKGRFELTSVLEVDESLFADCISIDIQINSQKPKPNLDRLIISQDNSAQFRQGSDGFPVKPNFRLRFNNESGKGYFTYEGSDDAVHTYYTEGTPANVSHAGSNSDLSALSIASGIPLLGVDDTSDNEYFLGDGESFPVTKIEPLKNSLKDFNDSKSMRINLSKRVNRDVYINNQPQLSYMRKEHPLLAKDEVETFAIENSPCDISIRSSLSDLTINVMDSPLRINRAEICEEPPSQILSPLRNVSPQSPNSMVFEETEEAEKSSEEPQDDFVLSESVKNTNNDWDHTRILEERTESNSPVKNSRCLGTKANHSTSFDFDSRQPLTPFEEALLKECIRLGMPKKKTQKQLNESYCRIENEELGKREGDEFNFSKFTFNRTKSSSGKNTSSRTDSAVIKSTINFEFDSSEPLSPFEEVLLEQCIRLGMPQKRNFRKPGKSDLDQGTENFDLHSGGLITPLETALLEQCIRLGMPQRRSQRKGEGSSTFDESHKTISYLTANLSKLKLNSENDKEKDALKKCELCSCGKKHGSRKKNINCKKSKSRLDHFKIESCPV